MAKGLNSAQQIASRKDTWFQTENCIKCHTPVTKDASTVDISKAVYTGN